jgi:hypothetical protein
MINFQPETEKLVGKGPFHDKMSFSNQSSIIHLMF